METKIIGVMNKNVRLIGVKRKRLHVNGGFWLDFVDRAGSSTVTCCPIRELMQLQFSNYLHYLNNDMGIIIVIFKTCLSIHSTLPSLPFLMKCSTPGG